MFERLKNEAGYSLVEVTASIVILSLAIIPMFSMFDMGLNAATDTSNHDKARSLANKQLERAKNLSYADLRDNFPVAGAAYTTGQVEAADQTDPDPEYNGFTYDVLKEFVALDNPTNPTTFQPTGNNTDSKMLRVTVTVNWGGGDCDTSPPRCYRTSGVIAE